MTARALPFRRRLLAAVLLAVIFGLMLDYQVGPGFCDPEHSVQRGGEGGNR